MWATPAIVRVTLTASTTPPVRPERCPRLHTWKVSVAASAGVTVCVPVTLPISRMSAFHCIPASSRTSAASRSGSFPPPAYVPMMCEQHFVTLSWLVG